MHTRTLLPERAAVQSPQHIQCGNPVDTHQVRSAALTEMPDKPGLGHSALRMVSSEHDPSKSVPVDTAENKTILKHPQMCDTKQLTKRLSTVKSEGPLLHFRNALPYPYESFITFNYELQ